MVSSRLQGSGTSIIIACASERPDRWSSSRTLSRIVESEPSESTAGSTFWRSSPNSDERNIDWRAWNQLTLPRSVLISPLWEMYR